jgi:predicted nucleic acid-binding protein
VILVDTNVLLDAVLVRMRWAADAVSLLAAAARGEVDVVATVQALATLDYVARKRSPMKVALIGVSGRVGSRLLTELLERGYSVMGIARDIRVRIG